MTAASVAASGTPAAVSRAASQAPDAAEFAPRLVPGFEPCLVAGLKPKAELSRTRVAISSSTPSPNEGCAPRSVSAAEFPPSAAPLEAVLEPAVRDPDDLAAAGLKPPPPDRPVPPSPGTGRNAASPSGGKSAAWRIDLVL